MSLWAIPGTADSFPEIDSIPHFKPSERKQLPWFEKSTLGAYRQVGSRNPKWDKDAEIALGIYARFLTGQHAVYGTTNYGRMVTCLSNAVAKGCDDPLINYAAVRLRSEGIVIHKQAEFDVYDSILLGLQKHNYPAIRHCRIHQRAVEAMWKAGMRAGPRKEQMVARLHVVADRLHEAINEQGDPLEIYETAADSLQSYHAITRDRKGLFDRMQTNFAKVTVKSVIPLGISTQFYKSWGWDARGNNFASGVPEDAWKLFGERLEQARQYAEEAYDLSQSDAYICKQMLDATGGGGSDEEFQLWYSRGIKADPSYYGLYICRLHYLQPQWGGSHQKMIEFARERVAEGNWEEGIPFILIGAYQKIRNEAYYQRPDVWKEIQSVFTTYLSKYPNNNVQKSAYCYYAARAGQWDTAKKVLDELGEFVVPHGFNGQYEFYKAEIEKKHQQKKSDPKDTDPGAEKKL